MPDVTLTPIAGDPWNGGAQPLDPTVAPSMRVTLPDSTAAQPAPAINTDGNALHRWEEVGPQPGTAEAFAAAHPNVIAAVKAATAVGTSLMSGHAYDDYAHWADPTGRWEPGRLNPLTPSQAVVANLAADMKARNAANEALRAELIAQEPANDGKDVLDRLKDTADRVGAYARSPSSFMNREAAHLEAAEAADPSLAAVSFPTESGLSTAEALRADSMLLGFTAGQAGSLVDVPRFGRNLMTGGYGDLIHDPEAWMRAAPDAINAAMWTVPVGPLARIGLKAATPLTSGISRTVGRGALAAMVLSSDVSHLALPNAVKGAPTFERAMARVEMSAQGARPAPMPHPPVEQPTPKSLAERGAPVPSGTVEQATLGAIADEGIAARLALRQDRVYPVPSVDPRPFEFDYPEGVPGHVGERLETDMDGQPIPKGAIIAGRRVVGGGSEALSPAEINALVERITGSVPLAVRPGTQGLPLKAIGAYTKNRGCRISEWDRPPYYALPFWEDGTIKDVVLSNKLTQKEARAFFCPRGSGRRGRAAPRPRRRPILPALRRTDRRLRPDRTRRPAVGRLPAGGRDRDPPA